MMAKAVAHHTTAAFIRVVGSEFVQKYLGEGPRMVRDVFRMARENAPAIIFIVRTTKQTHAQARPKLSHLVLSTHCVFGCSRLCAFLFFVLG